jgi:DNA gyrase subunit A
MSNENNTHNHGNITSLLIQDEMKSCYLDYAMSVIVGRALPDVRDGLKPVHRRVLYAMHMLNNYHSRPYLKSARVVGDVIGKYHPHGDSAVYSAIVRLAQDFSMRYPIVDGQGNFGSIDGDSAAAMRYTEIRMESLAEEILQDIDMDTVSWQANYDGSLQEPTVLPTRVPNLLINGSTGIAVGMATNIPPHNLTEIMSGLIAYLDNPNITIEELMTMIPGPDFPTAGAILGTAGIKSAYYTGKGVIQLRAIAEIEASEKDRERIVITELPYQVNKAKLIERIAELANAKEIEGVSAIRDESNRLGIRIVIDVKKAEPANVLLNNLFKMTQMQVSFGIIFLSIHNGQPKVMNIKEQLQYFYEHRKEIVVKRTAFELRKAKEKAHLLEGLKIAVENIDAIVELIKKASGPDEARTGLISKYALSEKQAQAILDLRLQRLTGLERDKIVKDYHEVMELIKTLEDTLRSEEKINSIIREEFVVIKEKYGDERRTRIEATSDDEFEVEDLIANEEVLVTFTHKGYLKRMSADTFKAQKRGGKGVKGGQITSDEDFYTSMFKSYTHDRILFFTDSGLVYGLKVYQLPAGERLSKGRNIANLIQLKPNEKIREIICIPKDTQAKFIMFATEQGLVKKTEIAEFDRINQNGKIAIKFVEGDTLVSAKLVEENKDVLLCSSAGKSIRFKEADCRPIGRASQGVKGIDIDDSEKVIGMQIIDDSPWKYYLLLRRAMVKEHRRLNLERRLQCREGNYQYETH